MVEGPIQLISKRANFDWKMSRECPIMMHSTVVTSSYGGSGQPTRGRNYIMRILAVCVLARLVLASLPQMNNQIHLNNPNSPTFFGIPINGAPQVGPAVMPQAIPAANPQVLPRMAPGLNQQAPLRQQNLAAQPGTRLIPSVNAVAPKSVKTGNQALSYSQKIGLDMVYKQIREVLEEDRLATKESREVKLGREWMAQFPDSPFNTELGKKLSQMERARKAQLNLKLYLLMEQKKSIMKNSKRIHIKEDLKRKQKRLRREYKSLMRKFVTFFHKIQSMSSKKIKAELNQTMNRISEQNRQIVSKNIQLQNTLNQKLDTHVNQGESSTSSGRQMNQNNMVVNAQQNMSNSTMNNSMKSNMSNIKNTTTSSNLTANNRTNAVMNTSQNKVSNKNVVNNSKV